MEDYEKKRKALLELIDEVHDRQERFFTRVVEPACSLALSRVGEVIDSLHDEEIAKLKEEIARLNANRSSGGFLVDLAFAIVLGPLFGHVAELGLKAIARKLIGYREQVFQLRAEFQNAIVKARGSLRDINAEYFTPAVMNRVRNVMLGDIPRRETSLQKYFEFFTPFANDAIQIVVPKAWDAASSLPTSGGDARDNYEHTAEMNHLPRSDLLDSIQDYVTKQVSTNLFNKFIVRWVVITMPATSLIDDLKTKFEAHYGELARFDDLVMKKDLTRLFEAMLWINYLGKPAKWASDRSDSGAYLHGYQKNPTPGPLEAPYVDVFELRISIAKSLFKYLASNFVVPNTNDTFLDHFRVKKQAALKMPWGYGIDQKDEAGGWKWVNYAPVHYRQTKPDKPIDDPTSLDYTAFEMAGSEMVRWFKGLEKDMLKQEGKLTAFLSSKGVKAVPQRPY